MRHDTLVRVVESRYDTRITRVADVKDDGVTRTVEVRYDGYCAHCGLPLAADEWDRREARLKVLLHLTVCPAVSI